MMKPNASDIGWEVPGMSDREIHVVTVGTSILNNFRKARPGEEGKEEALVAFVGADPEKASAELAAMAPYLAQEDVGDAYLVHTAPGDGELAAHVLRRHLHDVHRVDACLKAISGFDDDGGHDSFIEGLNELIDGVSKFAIRKEKERRTIRFNATGGTKPAMAMLVHVGCSLGWPVYYRHETMARTVELPRLPPVPSPGLIRMLAELEARPDKRVVGADAARLRERAEFELALRHRAVVEKLDAGVPYACELGPVGRFLLAVYGARDAQGAER
jgi:putative CRISPR-associated protein (TIGR02619 family)